MASATLTRIKQRLDLLRLSSKISSSTIADAFGISPMKMSNALSGKVYLGAEDEAALSNFTLRLVELEDAIKPLALPADGAQLRTLVQAGLEVESVRSTIQILFNSCKQ